MAPDEQETVKSQLWSQHSSVPVFVPDDLADKHYNGFSNSILWPLFHYHPGEISFSEVFWDAYQRCNEIFADAISEIVKEGDLVWIHDYHLVGFGGACALILQEVAYNLRIPQMLVPMMLRQRIDPKLNVKIGFFLHTPFPSSEIYRILPVRREVLLGVIHSDLIGFHTYDYGERARVEGPI